MLSLRDKGEIEADPDEAREIAFAWFRLLYEDRMATAFEWLNPTKARLSQSQPMRHVGLRLQRLAARATYLAVYAVLLEMTRRQLGTEGFLRPSGTATIPSIIPLVYLPYHLESTAFHERSDGFVVFPAIPELDLSELWPGNFK
ncbi:hypothetical protein [Paraburkholderia terrae]|nr:hypothetical protein [Paraburkholderia terrae]